MMDSYCSKEVEVRNKLGIHARAASQIVKLSSRYNAEIFIEKNGLKVNGKSIMGILMLAAAVGSRLTIHARGADAPDAVESLAKLVEEDLLNEKE